MTQLIWKTEIPLFSNTIRIYKGIYVWLCTYTYVGNIVDFIKLTSSRWIREKRDNEERLEIQGRVGNGGVGAATQDDSNSQRHLNELTKCKGCQVKDPLED